MKFIKALDAYQPSYTFDPVAFHFWNFRKLNFFSMLLDSLPEAAKKKHILWQCQEKFRCLDLIRSPLLSPIRVWAAIFIAYGVGLINPSIQIMTPPIMTIFTHLPAIIAVTLSTYLVFFLYQDLHEDLAPSTSRSMKYRIDFPKAYQTLQRKRSREMWARYDRSFTTSSELAPPSKAKPVTKAAPNQAASDWPAPRSANRRDSAPKSHVLAG